MRDEKEREVVLHKLGIIRVGNFLSLVVVHVKMPLIKKRIVSRIMEKETYRRFLTTEVSQVSYMCAGRGTVFGPIGHILTHCSPPHTLVY